MEKQTKGFFLLIYCFSPSVFAAASEDAAILLAIAKSLVDVPSNWHSEPDPCSWYGIKCRTGRITAIDLHSKGISGTLSDSLGKLSSLENLDLGENQISGRIPSLAGLSALLTVNLEHNAFTSVAEDFFSGLTSLRSMVLDNNPLAPWSIPHDLSHCTSLNSFSATNASVIGIIPDIFGHLSTMKELNIAYNILTGGLPSSFARSSIKNLYLNNQQPPGLSGKIDVIGSMPQLQSLWLQSNNFTGPIPDLSKLTNLTSFNVLNNQLTGPVPSSLTSGSSLKLALLSNNMLQGEFPNFPTTVTVDVSEGNKFCNPAPGLCDPRLMALLSVAGGFGYPLEIAKSWKGNDPCSIRLTGVGGVTCDTMGKDIVVLDYSGRHYSGTISPDIANLTSLTKIILSDNNLTGPIPDSLMKLSHLKLLDVTNNSLTGKIPDFSPSVLIKASGNPMLQRNYSLGPSGNGGSGSSSLSGVTPSSSSIGHSSNGSSSSYMAIIEVLITFIFVVVCCSACVAYHRRQKYFTQKSRQLQTRIPRKQGLFKINMASNVHDGAQCMVFSFQALQKATNDFCEVNILSRDGFGVVYKGNHNGTLIAVKRHISDITDNEGMKKFRAEINVLKKIRHRYLVALLGYCIDAKEILLVYEYMLNGTLGQHLFVRSEHGRSALCWKQRLIIAVDVARGIEYLHDLAQESFIHRDLNPSNILLDKDLRAKVSNFGLVKDVGSENSISTRVAGTFGYLAPEYAITGKISTKIDVYAFGVILMELITGRRAIDESLAYEESHLVKLFRRNIVDKKFMNYVDPTLDLNEEAHSSMPNVAELAFNCTAREPNQRPDMGHVVNVLVPFVEKWDPSSRDDEINGNEDSSTTLSQKLRKWQLDDATWQFDDGTSTKDSFHSYEGSQNTKNDG